MSNIFSFNAIESNSFNEFGEHLYDILKPILDSNRNIIFLCIGSDKSTGDSKFMVLQTTRLYTVFTLAEFISKGISYSIDKLIGKNLFIESLSDY